jgi:splicing suppressor protein 51
MSTSAETLRSCTACHKLETDLGQPLKHCAKCPSTLYCSAECQKSDWKVHKAVCAHKPKPKPKPVHNPGFHFANALTGLNNGNSLHVLSEKDAFLRLIDCFRLRCEDEYAFAGNTMGIYNEEDPRREFRRFLDLAEKREGLLPPWWNKEKRKECVRLATVPNSSWGNINHAVEKSDIQEHYGDNMMPMQLRVLGEKIYGKGFM